MKTLIILAIIFGLMEIFGKKKPPSQAPRPNRPPEQGPDGDFDYENGPETGKPEKYSAQKQETAQAVPKWLQDVGQTLAGSSLGNSGGEWQRMIRPEPVPETKAPVPKAAEPRIRQNQQNKPVAKPQTVTAPVNRPKAEPNHFSAGPGKPQPGKRVFEGKTVDDIKEVIIMSELLGPPLALRKNRRLI